MVARVVVAPRSEAYPAGMAKPLVTAAGGFPAGSITAIVSVLNNVANTPNSTNLPLRVVRCSARSQRLPNFSQRVTNYGLKGQTKIHFRAGRARTA